jgi:hypothetical protein
MRLPFAAIALSLCFLLFASSAFAQPKKSKTNNEEADAEAAQQRTVAISLVTSLADEARSFKDQTRRARVQARAADVLWDTDPERARELFRRAWEAAEKDRSEAATARNNGPGSLGSSQRLQLARRERSRLLPLVLARSTACVRGKSSVR